MNLLQQYDAGNPSPSSGGNVPVDMKGQSFLIRTVVKLSGGMIRDAKQANYALIGVAVLFFLGSIIALVWGQVL